MKRYISDESVVRRLLRMMVSESDEEVSLVATTDGRFVVSAGDSECETDRALIIEKDHLLEAGSRLLGALLAIEKTLGEKPKRRH